MLWRRVTGQEIISCDINKNAEKSVVAFSYKIFSQKASSDWQGCEYASEHDRLCCSYSLWSSCKDLKVYVRECCMCEFARLLEGPIFCSCQKLSSKLYQCTFCYGLLEIKYSYIFANNNANNIAEMVFAEKYLGTRREFVEVFCQWRHSDVFIVNFEHILLLVRVFLLSTLSKWMPAGYEQQPWTCGNILNWLCVFIMQVFITMKKISKTQTPFFHNGQSFARKTTIFVCNPDSNYCAILA